MIRFQLWGNDPDKIRKREQEYANKMISRFHNKDSSFDYGLKWLFLENKENPIEALNNFSRKWWKNPQDKLNFRNYDDSKVSIHNGYVKFPSILSRDDEARFVYVRQPKWRSGHKVAIIMLKHWNADTTKYLRGINFIRRALLPISTGLFLPSYQNINPLRKGIRQNQILGANIGLTIRRVWQDVLDLQYFGNWLKENEGFEEVGVFPYSIGSLRGVLASLFAPDVFDFGVFHYVADDYTEAFMKGVTTQPEAAAMRGNVTEDELRRIWSVISPGSYEDYLDRLSNKGKGFRLVQAKYDLVFGEKNVERFSDKVRKKAPDVEIYEGEFGHTTMAEVENAVNVMIKDLHFIYKNTSLKYF